MKKELVWSKKLDEAIAQKKKLANTNDNLSMFIMVKDKTHENITNINRTNNVSEYVYSFLNSVSENSDTSTKLGVLKWLEGKADIVQLKPKKSWFAKLFS